MPAHGLAALFVPLFLTRQHLCALMSRSRADVRLAALMLDGIELKGRCCVVALGVTTDGVKVPLGLWTDRRRT